MTRSLRNTTYTPHSMLMLAATLIAVFAGMALSVITAAPANAVMPIGPGYQIPNPYRDSIIGGYRAPDGTILYCLEWGAESPTGPNDQIDAGVALDEYAGWSHLEIARVNYLITTWGQTADNNQAAAVAMAIWMRHPGTSDPFFSEHRFVKATIRDSALRASIAREAARMNAAADTFVPQSRAAIGTLKFEPDTADPFSGSVTISGLPVNTRGTILLSGAVFDTTQSSSAAGVGDGDQLRYHSVIADNEFGSHRIGATASLVTPGGPGDKLVVWRTPPGFQDLGESTELIPDFEYSLSAEHETAMTFSPTLVTNAQQTRVLAGQPLVDMIDFDLAEGSLGWRKLSDGSYLEVEAWCQAYGPLASPPQQSDQAPTDAPKFGERVVVEVGGSAENPLEDVVAARVEKLPKEGGHYTFVCGIEQTQQSSLAARASLPTEYSYQHEFGLVAETTVVQKPLANTGLAVSLATTRSLAVSLVAAGLVVLFVIRSFRIRLVG